MTRDGASARDVQLRAKIFISYSRKDIAFVNKLEAALKARAFEPLIDRTEIFAFEDWWKRIEALIGRSDTVVFVLSPDAVSSDVALKEVAHAWALNKRFAPIVARRVEDATVPEALRRLNFIFFDDGDRFEVSADQLAQALNTDIGWVRKHTDFGEAARRWASAGRPSGLLLRSPTLEEAELWIASRPQGAPEPTAETQAFISASRKGAARRRNILTGSLSAGLITAVALAGFAFWQRGIALDNEKEAHNQSNIANDQRERAQTALALSQKKESLFLAQAAQQELRAGNSLTGLQVSLRGLPRHQERPFVPEAFGALIESFNEQRLERVLAEPPDNEGTNYAAFGSHAAFTTDGKRVFADSYDGANRMWDAASGQEITKIEDQSAVFSPDGTNVITVSGNVAKISDLKTGQGVVTLVGTRNAIRLAVFSPSGTRVLTADSDSMSVWDVRTGQRLAIMSNVKMPGSVVFSPDGSRVLTLPPVFDRETKLSLWDASTGVQITGFDNYKGEVNAAAFNFDGSRIVTASADKTARIWDAASGSQIGILQGHTDEVVSAAFSPDGMRVVTASKDRTARVWDIAGLRELVAITGNTDAVLSASFSPDGLFVLTTSADDTVRLWDAKTAAETINLNGHIFEVDSATFSPDGSLVLTTSKDQRICLWKITSDRKAVVLRGHEGVITSATFSSDGTRVVTTSMDADARLWDSHTGRSLGILTGHKGPVEAAVFSPTGKYVVTRSQDASIRLWDASTARQVNDFHAAGPLIPALSPDSTRLAFADSEGVVRLWDVSQKKELAILSTDNVAMKTIIFSPDSNRILTRNAADEVSLWDAKLGRYLSRLWSKNTIYAITFSPDGARILIGDGAAIFFWNAATGSELSVSIKLPRPLRFAAFSPDGNRVVTASLDNVARIWDTHSGLEVAIMRGHEDVVTRAVFSPDGNRLLTVSNDNSLRLWDSSEGKEIAVLRWQSTVQAGGAGFSPDGEHILAVFDDNTVRILWIGKTIDDAIGYAAKTLPFDLKPDEERRFFLSMDGQSTN
jgi:WD40 repeat protein